MFYPTKLDTTLKGTIGKWYTLARRISTIVVIVSGFVFGYVNASAGFWMLLLGSFAQVMLVSREHYISSIQQIKRGGDLLERLHILGDRKFVLERLVKDAEWRGDAVDPYITSELAKINDLDETFKTTINKFLDDLHASLADASDTGDKSEDPKAN